jgi:hypothetical protein
MMVQRPPKEWAQELEPIRLEPFSKLVKEKQIIESGQAERHNVGPIARL